VKGGPAERERDTEREAGKKEQKSDKNKPGEMWWLVLCSHHVPSTHTSVYIYIYIYKE